MTATTRVVRKQLACMEDLLFGVGTVTQTRNGVDYEVTKVTVIMPVASQEELDALDTNQFKYASLNGVMQEWDGNEWISLASGAASGISVVPVGNLSATDVQAALAELDADLTAHIDDATAAHTAEAISSVPTGTVVASNVQAAIAELDAKVAVGLIPARNGPLNQEAITQGEATTTGSSSTIYTGSGVAQFVTTGVDMTAGGLVWVKNRSASGFHAIHDSVRGATKQLYANLANIEVDSGTTGVTAFNSAGFEVGTGAEVNGVGNGIVAWSFQTTQEDTGVTNRNKAYTTHYNTDLGFSIVGYEGDGQIGHELPHGLSKAPTLSLFKNRDVAFGWVVQSSLLGETEYLVLNTSAGKASVATVPYIATASTVQIGSDGGVNGAANNMISYHFADVEGSSKVGLYVGTGATGNHVKCGFKPALIIINGLSPITDWGIKDTARGIDESLIINSAAAEVSSADHLDIADDGFVLKGSAFNGINQEWLFMAFAESSSDVTKAWTDYSYATTPDTITVQPDTVLSFADGFNASGQVDTQESVLAGTTVTLGAGYENKHYWLYKDKAGGYDVTESRPLEGMTRATADTYGEVSPLDEELRTTARHFSSTSKTGIALASAEFSTFAAWAAFNKGATHWAVATTTLSWVQYKQTEKRILKSWRLSAPPATTQTPRRFTIEGSNDGLTWSVIDAAYASADYVGTSASAWGAVQDTSANTTAYLYHRINITANNGDATYTGIGELEFNTVLASDYFIVPEGAMYDETGAPISRVYLAELSTDSEGNVATYRNLQPSKQRFSEVEVHQDMAVRGNLDVAGQLENKGVATAWVNFDGVQNPPLIKDSYNVADVVDLGTGNFQLIFETPLDNTSFAISGSAGGSSTEGVVTEYNAARNTESQRILSWALTAHTLGDFTSTSVTILGGKD